MSFGVRAVSEVVSVTRKRIYALLGEVSRPSEGTAAQSLQSVRSSLVDVSTKETAVVPEIYSLVTDTRPVPERLHSAAAVVSTPSDGYTPAGCPERDCSRLGNAVYTPGGIPGVRHQGGAEIVHQVLCGK